MERLMNNIRVGIFALGLLGLLVSLLNLKGCSTPPMQEYRDTTEKLCFFPPDLFPHPHVPWDEPTDAGEPVLA